MHVVDMLLISSLGAFMHALLSRAYLCAARCSCNLRDRFEKAYSTIWA